MRPTAIHRGFHLDEVRYEIRGPCPPCALEAARHVVLQLNTGNQGRFGFRAPAPASKRTATR